MANLILTKITDETKVTASVEEDFIAIKNVGDQKVELVTETSPLYAYLTDQHIRYDANFVHTQSSSSSTWVINHNLGKYCSVIVVDDNDDVIIGEIHYNSVNQVTLTFTASFTGKAYIN